ncbi:type IV toxin-antitoxin system AbiEi family antitoxin [Dietzia sp. PP-33]|uniref:type IV toxin-antitoxin system AbiEi family antitoxin n=1 Tax=Dietzia sp. PP-33 TaxID=2957500 RepID=UPI0029B2DCB7|nr:type IV toxin-antitoxin system AbiEi family antitoxin [Dietzia sp. PP-33]MDX2356935.1 hypothetical protein [Dietzia sp. PP-33]
MRRDPRPRAGRPPLPHPTSLADAVAGGRPFRATHALAEGLVTRHSLGTGFIMVVPGVYATRGTELTGWDRIRAVWLWAPADAVIGGWAAAYLHGERWYSGDRAHGAVDVLTGLEPRIPAGVRERRIRRPLTDPDIDVVNGVRITTPARTAVDVARWARGADRTVAMIDSVCNATGTDLTAVAAAAGRMPGQHGVSRVVRLLPSCDPRADSPPESMLRLAITRSDLPNPTPQLRIHDADGRRVATADLGYEREKVAIFYDGEVHVDPEQWRWDIRVNARLAFLGWQVVRVVGGMDQDEVLRDVGAALDRARRSGSG